MNDNTPQWRHPNVVGRQSSSASGPSGAHIGVPSAGGERGNDRKGTSPASSSSLEVNINTDTPLGTTLLQLDAIDLDEGTLEHMPLGRAGADRTRGENRKLHY